MYTVIAHCNKTYNTTPNPSPSQALSTSPSLASSMICRHSPLNVRAHVCGIGGGGNPHRPSTFLLHTEAMNLLLVMASTQLTSPAGSTGATAHPFLATMMTKTQLAPALVRD